MSILTLDLFLSLAARVILGETPSEEDYKNVGYGLNMLVGDGVQKGKIGEGIKGYEDGGMIDDYYAMAGIDIGRWATDTFKKELSTTLYKNFNQQNITGQWWFHCWTWHCCRGKRLCHW